jgi:hypothetical protein
MRLNIVYLGVIATMLMVSSFANCEDTIPASSLISGDTNNAHNSLQLIFDKRASLSRRKPNHKMQRRADTTSGPVVKATPTSDTTFKANRFDEEDENETKDEEQNDEEHFRRRAVAATSTIGSVPSTTTKGKLKDEDENENESDELDEGLFRRRY